MQNEIISVIVPVYNVEKYLDRCIKSIVEQSYEKLEIILVDDGSTDSSGDICDEWARKDERITVIHKENGGISSTRNAGIDNATGKYIGCIDSDDFIDKDMYKIMHEKMVGHNADLVICNFTYVDEDGKLLNDKMQHIEGVFVDEILDRKEIYEKLMTDKNYCYSIVWNKLYKREIFDDLRFKEGVVQEDERIAHYVYGKCKKVIITGRRLVNYVQRPGSIMNTTFRPVRIDGIWAFLDRYEYFMNKGMRANAFYALRQSYASALNCIEKLNVCECKDELEKAINNVKKALGLDIRRFKLARVYKKKIKIDSNKEPKEV